MSRIDRALGLIRSIAVYHAIPGRRRRMRRLYRQFVARGDLAFDIGAHAGNRTRTLLSLGCRVVAVEPQPDFARLLRTLFGRRSDVMIEETAVRDAAGRVELSISERTPTVTTAAPAWRNARAADPDFARVQWGRRLEVEATTLDRLIARHGAPSFIKIDVEGSEPAVLQGLSRAVPALSFEYLPRAVEHARACVERLASLAPYEFNWSPGESYELAEASWISGEALLARLLEPPAQRREGEIYARRRSAAGTV